MSRETIATDNAPSAIGTYSQAVKTGPGSLVFTPMPPDQDPGYI